MKTIDIDIETYSGTDLSKSGVYRYAEDPDFEVLLFGCSVDGGPVEVYDLAQGEKVPDEIKAALSDPTVRKWAHNAAFERVCLSRFLGLPTGTHLSPEGWRCSMIWAAYLGLPLSLAQVGAALDLSTQKMTEGKDPLKYFCTPCKPTGANRGRTRNLPAHDPERWELFKAYNKRDVEVEMAIQKSIENDPVPDFIWDEYCIDQEINDRGIMVDMELVRQAIAMDGRSREMLTAAMQDLTNLDNPNSVVQMKQWLAENGLETDTLGKKMVEELLRTAPEPLRTVLTLRQQLAKSSVRKYQAMQNAVCADGRCRGMFQFYGANRSGRWAGRLIQIQNLYRNSLPDLDEARELVRQGNYDGLAMLYDSVPEVLAELVRTAFIPAEGYTFYVADFSAVEARVLSWLAGEKWRMDVFAHDGDIYCETASQMFHVPVVKHGVNGELRQSGKLAELACIAEDSPVLTDRGEVPIQDVRPEDKVWDGEEWVHHDGVVYRGKKSVLSYSGLTATPDHLVYVEGRENPIPFIQAAQGRFLLLGDKGAGEYYRQGFAPVYDILNAGSKHRFTVSGKLVHNCGYGGSIGAMKAFGAPGTDSELRTLVNSWREANPNIVNLWWEVDRAIKTAVDEVTTTHVGCLAFQCRSEKLFITLPSGRQLCYIKPKPGKNKFGGDAMTYKGLNAAKKWERIESYGPKFVENCVAGGTLVLTDRGLVPIEEIKDADVIWDGVEWVHHKGLLDKGCQKVIAVGGLFLTPDHKILTEKGWVECGKAGGLNWAGVSLPDSFKTCGEYKAGESAVAVPMRVRERGCNFWKAPDGEEIPSQVVWMHEETANQRGKVDAWDVPPSGVRSLAFDEAEMRGSEPSRISQLWCAWNHGLSGMGAQLRAILGGHGTDVQKRIGFRPHRQQQWVQSGKLPLGKPEGQLTEQKNQQSDRDSVWGNDSICTFGIDGNRRDNSAVSAGSQLADRISVRPTGCQKPVYDILDCGPRHRFAVYDGGKLRIVSNCVQAISRDILMYAMENLRSYRIVAHVHDEVIIEAPETTSLDEICSTMGQTPPWAEGLVLNADGYVTPFYKKD